MSFAWRGRMNIHSLSLSLSPLGSALTSMSTQNRQVVSLTHAKERWMDEEEKGREGGRNRERERESDRKTGYENQAEILHYDESFAPTFSSLLTLNPLPPLSLSLSSGPMCFLTISTFSCACRYPHPQSSSSLSTFLPASYPTYRRTGTRENAFLALRKDVYSCDVSFFFLFFFFDNAQDADVFWRGRGRIQGGELRRSMTSFHPIHEITTSDDH